MKWEIRRATVDDLPAIAFLDESGFGYRYRPGELDEFRPLFEPERFLVAGDPAEGIDVGVTGSFSFPVTVPGGGPLPAQGVTLVAVAATHRRRGVLRALFTEQHRGFVDEGLALSVLTASEGAIYGRYGYAPVGRQRGVRIERRFAEFRPGAPDPGGVRMVGPAEARAHAPEVHRRWAAHTPGAISRDERWWDRELRDREDHRDGETALFFLIHPDGYAAYRYSGGGRDGARACRVVEFFAATDLAHVALWRVLLGLDLVDEVRTAQCPLDDPLPHLLTDPRQVQTEWIEDGLWARVLDVPVALAARRYPVELDVVLELTDGFLGQGGRYRLRGGPDGAECAPHRPGTGGPAQVRLDIGSLAQLLFGSYRAVTLARAGLVDAEPAVLARLDAGFTADRQVHHGTEF
ncbi:MAG TPA: GNAT family N-acetyltransferase [Pseudonocardia sp.]